MFRSASKALLIIVPVFLAIGLISALVLTSTGGDVTVFPSLDNVLANLSQLPSATEWFRATYQSVWMYLLKIPESWANVESFGSFWVAVKDTFFGIAEVPVGIITILLYPLFMCVYFVWAFINMVVPLA